MKILFISHYYYPHIGGVEKHVKEVVKALIKMGHKVTILTEKYDSKLKSSEVVDGARVVRFSYPHTKLVGLLFVWWQILKNINLIKSADVVHIHDVFIWYIPFRILFPFKKVVTTIHGLEWGDPLNSVSIFQKKLAIKLSNKTVGIGKFLEKYLKVKFDLISYGAATPPHSNKSKSKNKIVYVGRLEENTGLLKLLGWLKNNPKYSVDFCGDGELADECIKFGKVHGFVDPVPFLEKAEFCVSGGYLAGLEGLAHGCKLKLYWNNKVKEDYWKIPPFYKLKGRKLKEWVKKQTWEKLADEYIALYHS